MTSYQEFTPGRKSNASRIIKYLPLYDEVNRNEESAKCVCISDTNKKNIASSGPYLKNSKKIRISQLVNNRQGGRTQYGNFYLEEPLNVNYLGRLEGMPGGSGTAPKNTFN